MRHYSANPHSLGHHVYGSQLRRPPQLTEEVEEVLLFLGPDFSAFEWAEKLAFSVREIKMFANYLDVHLKPDIH